MRKSGSRLVLGLLASLVLAQPLQALADSKGSKSGSSESRSGSSESRPSNAMASRMESRTPDSRRSSEKNESSDDGYGHERGEGRHEWNASRHQEGMAMNANRPALTPQAAALMTQARQAAFEYRTTGSASSLAALESLRSSLASMGFTRMPGGNLVTPAPAPVTPAPVLAAPTTPAPATPAPAGPAAGTPVALGTSGVLTP